MENVSMKLYANDVVNAMNRVKPFFGDKTLRQDNYILSFDGDKLNIFATDTKVTNEVNVDATDVEGEIPEGVVALDKTVVNVLKLFKKTKVDFEFDFDEHKLTIRADGAAYPVDLLTLDVQLSTEDGRDALAPFEPDKTEVLAISSNLLLKTLGRVEHLPDLDTRVVQRPFMQTLALGTWTQYDDDVFTDRVVKVRATTASGYALGMAEAATTIDCAPLDLDEVDMSKTSPVRVINLPRSMVRGIMASGALDQEWEIRADEAGTVTVEGYDFKLSSCAPIDPLPTAVDRITQGIREEMPKVRVKTADLTKSLARLIAFAKVSGESDPRGSLSLMTPGQITLEYLAAKEVVKAKMEPTKIGTPRVDEFEGAGGVTPLVRLSKAFAKGSLPPEVLIGIKTMGDEGRGICVFTNQYDNLGDNASMLLCMSEAIHNSEDNE